MINRTKQRGFTLIELMVVIVIIGILVAIALPNFMGATDRAKVANTKANMHTLQTMLETYAVDWGGLYPTSYALFMDDAGSNNYAKVLRNPVDGTTATATLAAGSAINASTTGLTAGAVYYEFQTITRYYLYGADSVGKAIKDKGGVFVLTNN